MRQLIFKPAMMLTYLLTFLPALLMALPANGQSEPTAEQWGVILNLSGRQRMLSQKMSKEYCLIAAEVNTQANRENLQKTMALFETTLQGLRDGDAKTNLPGTTNTRIVKQLDKVAEIYAPLQDHLSQAAQGQAITPEGLAAVAEHNLPLLKNMNKAVKMYEREAKKVLAGDEGLAIIINLAGRQRMLTQKMSKEFLLIHLGVDVENNKLNLQETAMLFDQTLNGLIDGDTDLELPGTPAGDVRDQLGVVKGLWESFQPVVLKGIENQSISSDDLQVLATANMPLLKNMNQAVKMFEGLAADSQVTQVQP